MGSNPRIGVGENIMLGRDSSVFSLTYQMVEEYQSWMYSQGHRENLLQLENARFGFGMAVGAGWQYAVQEFACPEE